MKAIQFSTVEKQCNIEIIELNTYFIAKAIKAQLKMHNALEGTKSPVYEKDTEGNTLKDANGNKIQKKDEKGNLVYSYDRYLKNENSVQKLHEALEFLDELCKGFEE
jgi:hypothetical protein